jgi:hypothetical protein
MIVPQGLPLPGVGAGTPATAWGSKYDPGDAGLAALFALALQSARQDLPTVAAGKNPFDWSDPGPLTSDVPGAETEAGVPVEHRPSVGFVPILGDDLADPQFVQAKAPPGAPATVPDTANGFRVLRLSVSEQALIDLSQAGERGLDLEVPIDLDVPTRPVSADRITIPERPIPVKSLPLPAAGMTRLLDGAQAGLSARAHVFKEEPTSLQKAVELASTAHRIASLARGFSNQAVVNPPVENLAHDLRLVQRHARFDRAVRGRNGDQADIARAGGEIRTTISVAGRPLPPTRSAVLPLDFAIQKRVQSGLPSATDRQAPAADPIPGATVPDLTPRSIPGVAPVTLPPLRVDGQCITQGPPVDLSGSPSLSFTVHGWSPDRPVTSIRITLEPAELGELQIHLRHQHGRVFARIIATRPEALPQVRAHFAMLKEALSEKGVEFGAFSLTAQSAFSAAGLARPVPGGTSARRGFAEHDEHASTDEARSDEERHI